MTAVSFKRSCSAVVYVVGDSGTALDLVCASGHDAQTLDRVRRIAIHAGHPVADALRRRSAILIGNADEWKAQYPDIEAPKDLGSACAVPLVADDRGIGAIAFDFPNTGMLGGEERVLIAALAHPNIVHAFDADNIGGTHLLVMEYIEGANDLAKLVKTNGPLPVPQACEFIRSCGPRRQQKRTLPPGRQHRLLRLHHGSQYRAHPHFFNDLVACC